MKVYLLNGPPRSGKDTAGRFLRRALKQDGTSHIVKFAAELKDATHRLYGLDVATDAYEDCKDEPNDDFLGLTPRQAYIEVSERYMKPVHGEGVFGELLARNLRSVNAEHIIITDSGFAEESRVLRREFPDARFHLIRTHRDGYDFSGDSRAYLHMADIFQADVYANTVEDLRRMIRELAATNFHQNPSS